MKALKSICPIFLSVFLIAGTAHGEDQSLYNKCLELKEIFRDKTEDTCARLERKAFAAANIAIWKNLAIQNLSPSAFSEGFIPDLSRFLVTYYIVVDGIPMQANGWPVDTFDVGRVNELLSNGNSLNLPAEIYLRVYIGDKSTGGFYLIHGDIGITVNARFSELMGTLKILDRYLSLDGLYDKDAPAFTFREMLPFSEEASIERVTKSFSDNLEYWGTDCLSVMHKSGEELQLGLNEDMITLISSSNCEKL